MMEYAKFVLGVRFAVTPLENMTPEKAFSILFTRIPPAAGSGLMLHGAWDPEAKNEPENAYICILSNLSLKRGKALYEALRHDGYLCSFLTAYRPFVENNYVERCGEVAYLGQADDEGALSGGDAAYGEMRFTGPAFRTGEPPRKYLLIAPEALCPELPAADTARVLMRCAAETFSNLRALPLRIASGGSGTVDALVTACHGRYLPLKTGDLCGILPDRTAVLETGTLSAERQTEALEELWGKGYRSAILAAGGSRPEGTLPDGMRVTVLSNLRADSFREDAPGLDYRSGIETVLARSGFFRLAADASLIVTAAPAEEDSGRVLRSASDTVLYHCRKENVPTALLIRDPEGRYLARLGEEDASPLTGETLLAAGTALMERIKARYSL